MNDEDDYSPTKSKSTQTDNYMKTQIIAPVMTRTQAKQQLNENTDHHLSDQTCDEQQQKRNIHISVDHSCVPRPNQLQTPVINSDSNKILPFTLEQLKYV